jgi:3-oxoacyl-[acyl-carrier protein] reductase
MATRKHKALVTGGSRGIGAAIAKALSAAGVDVWLPSRRELDLASPESIEGFLAAHCSSGVDILVNNAGVNHLRSLEEVDSSVWSEMMQVNLTAPLKLCQGLSPGMRKLGWGRILNVSSIYSLVTKEKRSCYSATKAGLNGLTRTLALELAPDSILVNSLCPGFVDTELTRKNNPPEALTAIGASIPLGRLASPDELAGVAAFLVSEGNSYLTGQTIVVDGGFTLR